MGTSQAVIIAFYDFARLRLHLERLYREFCFHLVPEQYVQNGVTALVRRNDRRFYVFASDCSFDEIRIIRLDCMYVSVRRDYEVKETAVYTILGYDLQGKKDILGLWLNETESKNVWMQIFDEIKKRGVEEIFFISMDGVSGLADGAKSIFPNVIVQRCIVHLIRNSIKYIPSKDYKAFTAHLKKIYGAPSLKAAENEFEKFKQTWSMYPGAVDVWVRNFEYVAQLFDYGSAIRKVMYTTNAVESIHSSFRKVTKQGAFPSENALLKLLYLRITELYAKWNGSSVLNWAMVRNQLAVNSKFQLLMQKYENLI